MPIVASAPSWSVVPRRIVTLMPEADELATSERAGKPDQKEGPVPETGCHAIAMICFVVLNAFLRGANLWMIDADALYAGDLTVPAR
jgi:hypothetical protein